MKIEVFEHDKRRIDIDIRDNADYVVCDISIQIINDKWVVFRSYSNKQVYDHKGLLYEN